MFADLSRVVIVACRCVVAKHLYGSSLFLVHCYHGGMLATFVSAGDLIRPQKGRPPGGGCWEIFGTWRYLFITNSEVAVFCLHCLVFLF